jgi:hypothetical protein
VGECCLCVFVCREDQKRVSDGVRVTVATDSLAEDAPFDFLDSSKRVDLYCRSRHAPVHSIPLASNDTCFSGAPVW